MAKRGAVKARSVRSNASGNVQVQEKQTDTFAFFIGMGAFSMNFGLDVDQFLDLQQNVDPELFRVGSLEPSEYLEGLLIKEAGQAIETEGYPVEDLAKYLAAYFMIAPNIRKIVANGCRGAAVVITQKEGTIYNVRQVMTTRQWVEELGEDWRENGPLQLEEATPKH